MMFPKREINKANTRLGLVNALLDELKTKPLSEVNTVDLCKQVGISKVTFFNYFKHKEELVELYIHLWLYKTSYTIVNDDSSMKENLKSLFESIYDNPSGMNIMMAYIKHISRGCDSSLLVLTECEKYQYCKECYQDNYKQFDILNLFTYILSKEKLESKTEELFTFFLGLPLSSSLLNVEPIVLYKPFVETLGVDQYE